MQTIILPAADFCLPQKHGDSICIFLDFTPSVAINFVAQQQTDKKSCRIFPEPLIFQFSLPSYVLNACWYNYGSTFATVKNGYLIS